MAMASGAQREPSMEEILASIRRIIEDSDPGRKQPEQPVELRQDPVSMPVAEQDVQVETFRAELGAAEPETKPFTLADVQAKLAAETRLEAAAASARESAPPRVTLAEIGAQMAAAAPPAAEPVLADGQYGDAAADDAATAPNSRLRQEPHFESLADVEISDVEISEYELSGDASVEAALPQTDADPADEEPSGRPAIISEHTGRQVAAAFGELSEAFASRSRKSFDEMAEEMLRPMLQDWLDNNLPTLVERLVREEIERVARGA